MLSRGFTGSMPELDDVSVSRAGWAAALAVPLLAVVICVMAWVTLR
jgi:cobalt/nickel transport system permease protein